MLVFKVKGKSQSTNMCVCVAGKDMYGAGRDWVAFKATQLEGEEEFGSIRIERT